MQSVLSAILIATVLSAGGKKNGFGLFDPLGQALSENQTERVLELVDRQPALLNAVRLQTKPSSHDGYTPLHVAAWNGNAALIEGLLKRGAQIDLAATQEQGHGLTPLHTAAENGRKAAVEVLLGHKANMNAKTPIGETALRLAVARNHLDVARLLLKAGADVDELSAAGMGNLKFLAQRRAAGVNVSTLRDGRRQTALHYAATCGQKEVAAWLIRSGADVNAESEASDNGRGQTPLHCAVTGGHLALVTLLLDARADVNAPGWGCSALQFAALDGQIEIARVLLSRGANVNSKQEHDGSTPLHMAALEGHLAMVKLLVENGADVNAKCDRIGGVGAPSSPSNDTPADYAARSKHPDVISFLASKGGKLSNQTPPIERRNR
jgi:ankyrin repeat protein